MRSRSVFSFAALAIIAGAVIYFGIPLTEAGVSEAPASDKGEKVAAVLEVDGDPLRTAGRVKSNPMHRHDALNLVVLEKMLWHNLTLSEVLESHLSGAKKRHANDEVWAWRILDHCISPRGQDKTPNKNSWTAKLDDPKLPQPQRDFYVAEVKRCEGVWEIASADDLNGTDFLKDAARQGQPVAEGYSILHCGDLGLDPNNCLDYLHQLITTRDPIVLEALSSLALSNGEPLEQAPGDPRIQNYGLNLASCKLGAVCTPDSPFMIGLCGSGCPAYASVQDAIRQTTDPGTYAEIEKYSEHLLLIINSGTDDWPEMRQA